MARHQSGMSRKSPGDGDRHRSTGIPVQDVIRPSDKAWSRQVFYRDDSKYKAWVACPECKFMVPVKANGQIGAHKVGSTYQQAWPCRGIEMEYIDEPTKIKPKSRNERRTGRDS